MYKLFIILLFLTSLAHSEQFLESLVSAGNSNNDNGIKIAVDSDGNYYVTGNFRGTVDFDPGAGTSDRTSTGSSDIFFAKYNSDGDLVWVQSIGGINGESSADIMLDPSGDVILCGYFNNTVDFDPTAGVSNKSASNTGGFFAKYDDADGTLIWVSTIGGTQYDQIKAMDLDAQGNIYVTGYMGGSADFDPGPGSVFYATGGGRDLFIAKYDNNGDLVWAYMMGGASDEEGDDIKVDASGNVYLAGQYLDAFDIDPSASTTNLSHNNSRDTFVAKFDSNGDFLWASSFLGSGDNYIFALDLDENNEIFVTGSFSNTTDFDPGAGTDNITPVGSSDVFLANLTSSGALDWVISFGNANPEEAYDLYYDEDEGIYISGKFRSTVDFDPSASTNNLISNGGDDAFVARYNTEGEYQDAFSFGGSGNDNAIAVITDGSRNVYITGSYVNTVDFDLGSGTSNAVSNGGFEIFAVVYSQIFEPSLTTNEIINITSNSARSGGSVTDNGGASVTEKGIVWSTNANPTISSFDGGGITEEGSGSSAFISDLSDLTLFETYYVRAYATNSVGTGYGDELSFTTKNSIANDGNQDGTPDLDQVNVATILSADGESYITVESDAGVSLTEVDLYSRSESEYVYPFGIVQFKVDASDAEIDILFHGLNNTTGYTYRKILSDSTFALYNDYEWTTRNINGREVITARINLTDGGVGDFDGEVNGVIYDPGGPAILTGDAIPIWDWWHVLILAGALLIIFRKQIK